MDVRDTFQRELLGRKRRVRIGGALLGLALALSAGAADDRRAVGGTRSIDPPTTAREQALMWMTIGAKRFAVTLEDNPTARAFAQMLPLTLGMPDLNDNEKHARLPRSLPTNAVRPGTIRTGDVMLYGSDTLVVFYKTFPSSYSYTRIGSVTQVSGLMEALGTGSQRVGFALE